MQAHPVDTGRPARVCSVAGGASAGHTRCSGRGFLRRGASRASCLRTRMHPVWLRRCSHQQSDSPDMIDSRRFPFDGWTPVVRHGFLWFDFAWSQLLGKEGGGCHAIPTKKKMKCWNSILATSVEPYVARGPGGTNRQYVRALELMAVLRGSHDIVVLEAVN